MRDDFSRALGSTESASGDWSFPSTGTARRPRDFQSLYERERARADRERARADAAEARCEELRWAEVAARSDAGSWKSRFEASRHKRQTAVEEAKEARRAAERGAFVGSGGGAPEDVARRRRCRHGQGRGGRAASHDGSGAASAPEYPTVPNQGGPPATQVPGDDAGPEGHNQGAALRGPRSAQGRQGGGDPEGHDPGAVGDDRAPPCKTGGLSGSEGQGPGAVLAGRHPSPGSRWPACVAEEVGGREEVAVSGAIRRRRRSPQGAAEIAAPEDDDQVVVPEQCPAAQDREGRAEPDRDIGNRAL